VRLYRALHLIASISSQSPLPLFILLPFDLKWIFCPLTVKPISKQNKNSRNWSGWRGEAFLSFAQRNVLDSVCLLLDSLSVANLLNFGNSHILCFLFFCYGITCWSKEPCCKPKQWHHILKCVSWVSNFFSSHSFCTFSSKHTLNYLAIRIQSFSLSFYCFSFWIMRFLEIISTWTSHDLILLLSILFYRKKDLSTL
jgi:hypothetical protein